MKAINVFLLVCVLLLFNCKKENTHSLISSNAINDTLVKKSKINIKNWHFKDIILDTIPGISLQRAYDSLLQNKKGQEVIVAIIDMTIDIEHNALKEYVWINNKEIPNNNIDDDANGYVDDIHGWNFLGNNEGKSNEFVNYEYTRILKKFSKHFENKIISDIDSKDSLNFIIYKRAKIKHAKRSQFAKDEKVYIDMVSKAKNDAEKELSKYFSNKNYTVSDLDSLKKVYPKDSILQKMILRKSNFLNYDFTSEYINDYKLKVTERTNKLLNVTYFDREIQGDNPEDILDTNYGNNMVNYNTPFLDHGTRTAGEIVTIEQNNKIKIMPLSVSAYGDEHDKDIALAIRYAVDNGAKVINMSFGKGFSLHEKWVLSAIKYAEKNNVLIVTSAGNNSQNLDAKEVFNFPNDHGYFNEKEISNNFIKVGSSSLVLDKNFRLKTSNYGVIDVDIFAPGKKIYTTLPNNKFTNFSGGTSSASAITSGVAALIFSYYPKLTASQVKHIIMDSGIEYTVEVKTPTKEDKKKTTPFNQLSKSGKVVNAYNALIMAEKISNQKMIQ